MFKQAFIEIVFYASVQVIKNHYTYIFSIFIYERVCTVFLAGCRQAAALQCVNTPFAGTKQLQPALADIY
ncbi:hypothetical protein [Cohnella nanjingensis]|uniref:hypothetical protein n=1 Tax=Cohnella nanjingensis TaxID=1387779 RepID=UPI001C887370|nr:hypothetical protein [Cohnella nanjingensis]